MPRLLLSLVVFVFLACLSPLAHAATYYLSPSGNDTANGSATSPWKTINKANGSINTGDSVIFKDGVYAGSGNPYVNITKAGTIWRAENKHKTIIDGGFSPSLLNGEWKNIKTAWDSKCGEAIGKGQYEAILKISQNNITVDGLFLKNSCGRGIVVADNINDAIIKNNRIDWTLNAGLYVNGETNHLQFLSNELTRISMGDEMAWVLPGYCNPKVPNDRYCVNISIHMSGENMIVRDNIIAWGRGEIAMTGSRNLMFEQNIIAGNKNNFYNGWANGLTVRNNIFWSPDHKSNPNTHWEKSNGNRNNWHISSRNEHDARWQIYASGLDNIVYYNNLIINNDFSFGGYHNVNIVVNGESQKVPFSTNTRQVYFGYNTLIGGSEYAIDGQSKIFNLDFEATNGIDKIGDKTVRPVDAQFTGIIENNIFDTSKNRNYLVKVGLSNNDQVTFRNNIFPTTNVDARAKGDGDIYTNDPGMNNAIHKLDFAIPAIGADTVDMTALRAAVNINNYRLKNTSPAINRGLRSTTTLNGTAIPTFPQQQALMMNSELMLVTEPRINAPDIGAFEYSGTNPPTPPPTTPTQQPTPDDWDLDDDSDVDVFDFNRYIKKVMTNQDSWSRLASFVAAFRSN